MEFRNNSVSVILIVSVALASLSCALPSLVTILPNFAAKIAATLLFVVCAYAFMIYNCVRKKGVANILFILLSLSIAFYYGQHILVLFDPDYLLNEQTYSVLDGRISEDCIIRASFLIIACLLLLTGAFLARNPTYSESYAAWLGLKNSLQPVNLEVKLKALKIVGVVFLLISIIPTIKYQLALYALSEMFGYLGRRNLESGDDYFQILGVSYLEITLAQFFLPALYALLMSLKSKSGKVVVYALMLLYTILYLMTGSRYNLLKMLCSIFLIRTIWIKPLNKNELKKYFFIGLVFVVLFSAGNVYRGSDGSDISLGYMIEKLSPSGTLWESGITFTSVSNVMDKCPSVVPFFYGKSWLGALLQCLPEFMRFGFFDHNTLQTSATFSPLYYNTSMFGYGSSFIAEGYYNFGYFILPVMIFFGFLLGKIHDFLQLAKSKSSPYHFLILVYMCGEFAYGVRNDLSSVPRLTLVTVVFIVAVSYVVETILSIKNNS